MVDPNDAMALANSSADIAGLEGVNLNKLNQKGDGVSVV
jgi:hypothetical protein